MRISLISLFLMACAQAQTLSEYVRSVACRTCHPAIYERWSKTRMANVVQDPEVKPKAILPDLSKRDRLARRLKGKSHLRVS